jgi:hypothetical protein
MRAARAAVALLTVLGVALAGFGWLSMLHRAGALDAGPGLREALPLQRLAGGASQPLARVIAAWLAAGLAGGALLYAVGLRSRLSRGAVVLVGSAALLLALGAAADAVTASETLRSHLAEQPQRAATWVAAALAGAGAALPGGRP